MSIHSKLRLAILTALPVLGASWALAAVGPGVGSPAPDFTLTDTEGVVHTLSDYQGRVVMLMIIGYG